MQPHKFIIGTLLFSLFVFGGIFVMYGDVEDSEDGLLEDYDVPKDSYASKLENLTSPDTRAEEIYNITSDQKEDTKEEIDKTTEWRIIDIGPVKAIRRMFNYFKSVNIMIEEIALLIHIPSFFIKITVTIILVTITFMVIYFIMRFQLRND